MGKNTQEVRRLLSERSPHENYAVALLPTAGNVNDCTAFEPLYRSVATENVVAQAAVDQGYDSDAIRETLAGDGIEPVT